MNSWVFLFVDLAILGVVLDIVVQLRKIERNTRPGRYEEGRKPFR